MFHRFSVGLLLLALASVLTLSTVSQAQIGVAITFGPPALPVYEQPPCQGDGYLWTPGYWAYDYDADDYYWVPGTWVLPPEAGLLWTPPYWAWDGTRFVFYDGYWGPEVGFYGGISYGFGYFGVGFVGGRWDNDRFFYNRAVTNVNVTNVRNVYLTNVNTTVVNRVSYNGGNGGITARPTAQEEAAAHVRHIAPVEGQRQQVQAALHDRQLRASANQGRPPVAATPKPGAFKDHAVAAREAGAPYNPTRNNAAAPRENAPSARGNVEQPREQENAGRPSVHVKDLPQAQRPSAPNSGNSKLDKKYQQQQEKMYAQQGKERQKLQQQQEREDQKMAKQRADQARNQQMEQRHQQQTAAMEQKHAQQTQKLQESQQRAVHSQSRPPKPPQEKPHE